MTSRLFHSLALLTLTALICPATAQAEEASGNIVIRAAAVASNANDAPKLAKDKLDDYGKKFTAEFIRESPAITSLSGLYVITVELERDADTKRFVIRTMVWMNGGPEKNQPVAQFNVWVTDTPVSMLTRAQQGAKIVIDAILRTQPKSPSAQKLA